MVCPYCGHKELKVIETRESNKNTTRRRRECEKCGKRFTTYERIENVNVKVIKKDGRIEDFDKQKIEIGILKAVNKRPVTKKEVEEIVNSITYELIKKKVKFIKSSQIGEMVLRELSKIDKLGALLFASVYKRFNSLEELEEELKRLESTKS